MYIGVYIQFSHWVTHWACITVAQCVTIVLWYCITTLWYWLIYLG